MTITFLRLNPPSCALWEPSSSHENATVYFPGEREIYGPWSTFITENVFLQSWADKTV